MIRIIPVDGVRETAFLEELRGRAAAEGAEVTAVVSAVLAAVEREGDAALRRYTKEFDGVETGAFRVDKAEVQKAAARCDTALAAALTRAAANIRDFHLRQKREGFVDFRPDGSIVGQRVRALRRVGIYVPGGAAAYPSSVLMNAIPAKIAGVQEIVMVTPPGKTGIPDNILLAASIAGVDEIYALGGAQAVVALALGTESIPRVDKIVGPGNRYVAAAKRLVFGRVDIDMIAGPSEILIIADETANPDFIAADMLSQAEHDKAASAMLCTTSQALAQNTAAALERRMEREPRRAMIADSLRDYGGIFLCPTLEACVTLANQIAPEHLEIETANPMELLGRIDNAGSVFLGPFAPEPLGDYYAGPNHVLPTGGTARFSSPLGVDAFVKRMSFTQYTGPALAAAAEDIIRIAQAEGLFAHAHAIEARCNPS